VLTTASTAAVDDDAIRTALAAQTGALQQVPSSVSAVKVDGRRSYDRVRAGEAVELAPRSVTVHRLDVHRIERPTADLVDVDVTVTCTAGTYIRAIARDAGAALGVGGHLTALRRTRVGPFRLEHARTLPELEEAPGLSLPLAAAVTAAFARRDVDAAEATDLSHGRPLPGAGLPGTYGVFAPDGRVLALVAERDGAARPVVVLAPAGG
jgi:tRNA pseudouridine55 synthase